MVAGLGVGAIVAVAAPLLGRDWGDDLEQEAGSGEEIVVELIPAGAGRPAEERSMSGSEPEVGR
jgi:hypothetical protein